MMHLTPLDWGARRFRANLGTPVTLHSAFIGGMYAQIGPSSIRTPSPSSSMLRSSYRGARCLHDPAKPRSYRPRNARQARALLIPL